MIKAALKKDSVSGVISELIKAGEDLKPLMITLGQTGVSRMKMGFSQGRSPEGAAWKPLKFRKGQPLRDTGRLMNSITHQLEGSDKVAIGTNVFYGIVHQFGATVHPSTEKHATIAGVTSKGAGFLAFPNGSGGYVFTKKAVKIPARPFVPESKMPPQWAKAFKANTLAHVQAAIEKGKK